MEIVYPDRLMGWVRVGAKAFEVRLKHEPNLFQNNAYVLNRISLEPVELPCQLLLDPERVIQVKSVWVEKPKRHIWTKHISYFEGSDLIEGDYLTVEPICDKVFVVGNEREGVMLRLKAIPPNIR